MVRFTFTLLIANVLLRHQHCMCPFLQYMLWSLVRIALHWINGNWKWRWYVTTMTRVSHNFDFCLFLCTYHFVFVEHHNIWSQLGCRWMHDYARVRANLLNNWDASTDILRCKRELLQHDDIWLESDLLVVLQILPGFWPQIF